MSEETLRERTSSYFSEIGGDFKGIQGDISGGTITQYIITQKSGADIRSQPLIPGSPYVGLSKFQTKDKDKFFGRDGQILSFSQYIEQNNLLLLMGASGSGKSSLVLAGLIPHFEDKWGTSQFSHLTFVPSQDPFKSLDKKIPDEYSNIVDCLTSEPSEDLLIQLVNGIKQDYERQLIFIDQFEELFTQTSKDKKELFIKCLLRLIQHQDPSIHLVMTMRSDFLGSLSPHPELATALEKHIRIIKDMTRDELRLAIAEPAARNHVTFEGHLVEKIIDDFLGQAGSLPLLQYTLDLLWEKDKELDGLTDQILNLNTYEVVGGVAGALQKQANRIYNQLTEAEQKIAQQVFIDLVDIVDEKRVSKPVELARFQDGGVQEKVVNTLVDNRLLVRGTEESETKPMVQVAHEELLRSWGMLDTLFKEKQEIILLRRRLLTDANQWQEVQQNNPQKATDELWGGSKLERILELMKDEAIKGIAEPVKQFIQASVAWRDRTQREQQKQIENLNHALTESRLREQAATLPDIRRVDSLQALVKTIRMTGENLDKLSNQILPPVQSQLRETMEAARISLSLEGHEDSINCVAISADSRWIVSGSYDSTLRVWDARSGTLLHTLQGHESRVYCVAISADSRWLVSGSGDQTLRVWDAQTGTLLHTLQGHESDVNCVAISADSQWLVSGSGDQTLRVWDAQTGKLLHTLQGHEDSINCVAISADSQWLVSGSDDQTLRVWDAQTGKLLHTLQGHESDVTCVAISADSQWLVSGSGNATLRVWDTQTGTLLHTLQGHESDVTCVAISADNQWLVSGSDDQTLRVWDARSGKLLHTLQGHESGVNCVAISADSQWLVSGSYDQTLRVWDAQTGTLLHILQGHKDSITCVAISPDSQWLVSGSEDGTLRVWRASLLGYLAVCCNRIRYHPVFKNPQTEDEKRAYDIAYRYVFNPQIGADELYGKAKQKITAKDYTAAVDILTLAIQLNPDYLQAYRDRARLFGHLQQYYRAIKECDRILEIHPDDADITYTRGLCYAKLDKLELAQTDYQQAFILYEQQGKPENAQKMRNLLARSG